MNAIVVGGGIIGPALAIGLKKLGFSVVLNEATNGLVENGGGVNIAPNGMRMISKYIDSELAKKIESSGSCAEGIRYYNYKGEFTVNKKLDCVGRYGYPLVGIKRHTLRTLLIEKALSMGTIMNYNKRLDDIKINGDKIMVSFTDKSRIYGDLIFGCDGNKSKVRESLFGHKKLEYIGMSAIIGISKLPPGIDVNFLNILRLQKKNIGYYKVNSEECVWFFPFEEKMEPKSWKQFDVTELPEYKYFTNDVYAPIPDILKNTERCLKVGLFDMEDQTDWYSGNVCLLGDAAHPISPFLGQGTNLGLEDVACLLNMLETRKIRGDTLLSGEITAIFKQVQNMRQKRTLKIAKNSRIMGHINYTDHGVINSLAFKASNLLINVLGLAALDPIYNYDLDKSK